MGERPEAGALGEEARFVRLSALARPFSRSDWLALQIEIAVNLEKRAEDMRPRDPGPTWIVTLEYGANRKRKALAVLHWAEAANKEGCYPVGSDWHALSAAVLGGEPSVAERGTAAMKAFRSSSSAADSGPFA
jgi:hypothetical protein